MRIDEHTVAQARAADVVAFFEKYNGFTFAHRCGEYRCKQHPSLAVGNDRLAWFWHSRGIGGHGAIDYLVKVENIPFRQAVEVVTGTTPITAPTQRERQKEEPRKSLMLPEKAGIPLRLYNYLCVRRGIDSDIVNTLIQKQMLYEDKRGNVVFVGFDEHGTAKFASVRGTYGDCQFRGDCAGSDKRYGFHVSACTPSERLYLYESPIDLMSHMCLEKAATGDTGAWKRCNRLSLAGTTDTAMPFFLNQHRTVKELVFCLDNDPPGRAAAANLMKKYADKFKSTVSVLPNGKDFNEDLQARIAQIRIDKRTKSSQRDVTI